MRKEKQVNDPSNERRKREGMKKRLKKIGWI